MSILLNVIDPLSLNMTPGLDATVYDTRPSNLHEHFCASLKMPGFTPMPRKALERNEEASPRTVQTIQAETLAVQRLNSPACRPNYSIDTPQRYRLGFPKKHPAWSRVSDVWQRVPGGKVNYGGDLSYLDYSSEGSHPDSLDLLRMWHGVYRDTTLEHRGITPAGAKWEACE